MENDEIETLFLVQDINKMLKFNTTSEDQLKQIDRIDQLILEKMKKLYVCE